VVLLHSTQVAERDQIHLPEKQFTEWTFARMDTCTNKYLPEWTYAQMYIARMDIYPSGHLLE